MLLNNAGINKPLFFLDITEENWQRIMDVNAWGTLVCMQEAAKQMRDQGKQDYPYKIINVGSILSRDAFDDVVPYAASKHAVLAFIKGGAKALIEHNITVNGVAPTFIQSDRIRPHLDRPAFRDFILERNPLGRIGDPLEVAGQVIAFAAPAGSYITGQVVYVDGGVTASQ